MLGAAGDNSLLVAVIPRAPAAGETSVPAFGRIFVLPGARRDLCPRLRRDLRPRRVRRDVYASRRAGARGVVPGSVNPARMMASRVVWHGALCVSRSPGPVYALDEPGHPDSGGIIEHRGASEKVVAVATVVARHPRGRRELIGPALVVMIAAG